MSLPAEQLREHEEQVDEHEHEQEHEHEHVEAKGQTRTQTQAQTSGEVQIIRATPAALWRRLGSWIIDGAIIGAVMFLYLKAAQALMHHAPPPTFETGLDWLMNRIDAYQNILKYGLGLAGAVGFVYSSLFHSLSGSTPGERLFGVKLVDGTGKTPSMGICVLRSALSLVSAGTLFLGYWMALFTRRRRTLHDALTATYVIRPLKS